VRLFGSVDGAAHGIIVVRQVDRLVREA
jgi:hypothetical protein